MGKFKATIVLAFIFLASVIAAFLFEESYRTFVRYLLKFYSSDHIVFGGKLLNFFSGSNAFVFSFGIFAITFSILIYKSNKKIVQLGVLLFLFLFSTLLSTWINSITLATTCTSCKDGIVYLSYLGVPYHWHFMISLLVSILPLIGEAILAKEKLLIS